MTRMHRRLGLLAGAALVALLLLRLTTGAEDRTGVQIRVEPATAPPGPVAVVDGTPRTGYRVAAIEPPPSDLDGRGLGRFVREATARSARASS